MTSDMTTGEPDPGPDARPDAAGETKKPCPWCGKTDRLTVGFEDIDGWIATVNCGAFGCDVQGPCSEFKYPDKWDAEVDAWERWNRRVEPPELTALRARVAELTGALQSIEWGIPGGACPGCAGIACRGHRQDCRIKAALAPAHDDDTKGSPA